MTKLKREFVKLEIRLLNDHRYFTLSEFEKLIYISLLMIAKITGNRIHKEDGVISAYLRTERSQSDIRMAIDKLKVNFPKLKENKYFYYFVGFKERMKLGDPKSSDEKGEDKDRDRDKDIRVRVRHKYISLKGWDGQKFSKDFYGRTGRAINTLLRLGNEPKILRGLEWVAGKWPEMFKMETLIKNWEEFEKHDSQPELLKRFNK